MKLWRITLIALLLAMMGLTAKAQEPKVAEEIPTVSYCDLTRDPAANDQKVVRVKVIYMVAFEASRMSDPACSDKDAWVKFDPTAETSTDRKVLKRFRRLTDAGAKRTREGGIEFVVRSVQVVWVGRFQGVKPSKVQDGHTVSFGFGHLNGFDYQFNVQRIEEVNPLPANALRQ